MARKLKFSLNGLTPTRISKFAIKKMFGEFRNAALPRMERADAFTLAEGGHSPLLCGDEGVQSSPRLVKRGFTLAEVLITLGVIGVVAAVTMPILIRNYQKTVIKSQFKKAYSTVYQAYNLAFADLGYNSNCHYGKGGSSTGTDCMKLKEAIEKHLNIVKTCRGHIFSEGCVPEYKDQQDLGLPSGCAGTYRSNLEAGSTAYVLQDGTVIFMYPFFAIGYPSLIYVDVNGKKGPNKWGYDVQGLSLYYAEPLPLKLDFIRDNCYVKEEGAYNIKDLLR